MGESKTNGAAALECVIGLARVAVPATSVSQIIEYELASPLPLARSYIGGLGVHDGRPLVSISLAASNSGARAPNVRRRAARGVLLQTSRPSATHWVLEIHEVRSFISISPATRRAPRDESLPRWLSLLAMPDGERVGRLDVDAMLEELQWFV